MADEVAAGAVERAMPLEVRFSQFEERYQREMADVRALSAQMQELITVTEAVLNELDRPGLLRRLLWRITGYSGALQRKNYRNQLKLQHTNMLLSAAIARQNRVIIEGLRLTLEKLHQVEEDARYLREMVVKSEERRERWRQRRAAWQARVRGWWERVCAWCSGRR
ncbi:MAG: hypothetical protein N2595_00320 [bacterium]|nr:hypothetical protein [bacterium]